MTAADSSDDPRPATRRARDAARLAKIFGDVLPETTSDERGADSESLSDDWFRSQVPPHHGS
ncbi:MULTISPECIES: hypothetical protein [Nocardia]|uniref:hypothetical protein n=1 Tax=Nocardia TaxID=1817 RepID=UPI000A04BD4E|nr:hypothetical protein [Nocardia anaemiae]